MGSRAGQRRRSPAGLANMVAARRTLGRPRGATDGRLRMRVSSPSPSACGRRRRRRSGGGGRCRGDYNYTEISPTIEASQKTREKLK